MNRQEIADFVWKYLEDTFPILKKTYEEDGCFDAGVADIEIMNFITFVGGNGATLARFSFNDTPSIRVNVTEINKEVLELERVADNLRRSRLREWLLLDEAVKERDALKSSMTNINEIVKGLREEYDWIKGENSEIFLNNLLSHLHYTPDNDEHEKLKMRFDKIKFEFFAPLNVEGNFRLYLPTIPGGLSSSRNSLQSYNI